MPQTVSIYMDDFALGALESVKKWFAARQQRISDSGIVKGALLYYYNGLRMSEVSPPRCQICQQMLTYGDPTCPECNMPIAWAPEQVRDVEFRRQILWDAYSYWAGIVGENLREGKNWAEGLPDYEWLKGILLKDFYGTLSRHILKDNEPKWLGQYLEWKKESMVKELTANLSSSLTVKKGSKAGDQDKGA